MVNLVKKNMKGDLRTNRYFRTGLLGSSNYKSQLRMDRPEGDVVCYY